MKRLKINGKDEKKKLIINSPQNAPKKEGKEQIGYSRLMAKYELDRRSHKKFRKKIGLIVTGVVLFVGVSIALFVKFSPKKPNKELLTNVVTKEVKQPPTGKKYGFVLSDFDVKQDVLKKNQSLKNVLIKYQVPPKNQEKILAEARKAQLSSLKGGSTLTILYPPNKKRPAYLICELSIESYSVYGLSDDIYAKMEMNPIESRIEVASSIVQNSLWEAVLEKGLRYELIGKMEEALAWTVDFYHLKPGDHFKLIYEAKYLDNKVVGVGGLQAIYFKNKGKEYYGYNFSGLTAQGFFDNEARPMKTSYLKAPVKYARISSKFDLNRFHPVLKEVKPHLGTDYAAPAGTPIIAVANGVVIAATFTENNGNYVKIKHNETYQTQYLHMQKFAKNIKQGSFVQQGQVIGYVGSTGLATGPHVCFRFWKGGQQVDPLKQTLPLPNPLPTGESQAFFKHRDSLKTKLDSTP